MSPSSSSVGVGSSGFHISLRDLLLGNMFHPEGRLITIDFNELDRNLFIRAANASLGVKNDSRDES